MCGRTTWVALLALVLLIGSNGVLADGVWEGQIVDENDDVEQQANMYMGSSDLEMISDGNTHVGLRFVDVDVPAGSAISDAYIEFHVDQIDADQPVNLLIYGDLSPNAAPFDSGDATNVSDRPSTAAQVVWSPEFWPVVDETHQTADISSIIEEIVGQAGWKSGNALVLIITEYADDPGTGFRTARGGPGDDSSLLHIEFGPAVKAKNPQPSFGETDVLRDADLSWSPGAFAGSHDVYFGTDLDAVTAATRADAMDVLISQGQTDTTLELARLEFGQTYYWRVDEVNSTPDATIHAGDIWSFTVEPFSYAVEGAIATAFASDPGSGIENVVNGSGLNENDEHSVESTDMWSGTLGADPAWVQFEFDTVYKLDEMLIWNYNVQFEAVLGFGAKEVTVEYSENGADWTVLGDVEFAQATSSAGYAANTSVDFGGVPVKFVRLTINSNHGFLPQYGLSEVRFMYVPAHARNPEPAVGATGVLVEPTMMWRPGREAASHEVYLGTAADALELVDTVADTSYAPSGLEFGTDYFWQIVEVNEAEAITSWPSTVWSLSVEEYAVIDDMESYDDDENRIFDVWLDGFVNGTNSTVGYFNAPFAEQSIVNSGSQSMPLEYANDAAPFYSEAELDVGGLDVDRNGAESLRLFVAGQAPGFFEGADGSILMNGIGNDIWGNADQFRFAYRQLTGDGSLTARVDYLDGTPNSWAKGGVMIRQSTDGGAINTFMAMTGGDGGGATYQQRMDDNGASVSQHTYTDGPFAPPYWVRVTREGDTLLGYTSPDGENWTQRGDVVTLAMTDPVLVGLALTSHNTGQATSAEFSNVSFTGNMSASWEMAEIGATQPEGNTPESLYVALEDSSGTVAVVTHPDAGITGRSSWTEWVIPYSELGGVNLNNVAIIYVGVGDRDNPTTGGTGLIFVDDVGFGRTAP